jgi:hypothetical protein
MDARKPIVLPAWLSMQMQQDRRPRSGLTPAQYAAILRRIQEIDTDMLAIQRLAATQGDDMRAEWDKLFAERTSLELKLWSDKPQK